MAPQDRSSQCATYSRFEAIFNHQRACAARVTVVGSVCLSVCVCGSVKVAVIKSHLTYGASVRPENAVTYSAGNEGHKFVGFSLKMLRC